MKTKGILLTLTIVTLLFAGVAQADVIIKGSNTTDTPLYGAQDFYWYQGSSASGYLLVHLNNWDFGIGGTRGTDPYNILSWDGLHTVNPHEGETLPTTPWAGTQNNAFGSTNGGSVFGSAVHPGPQLHFDFYTVTWAYEAAVDDGLDAHLERMHITITGTHGEDNPEVPLPGAIWLLGSGLIGLVGLRRKFQG